MSLPIDLALTLASAGVPVHADDDELLAAIRRAIADRRGYVGPVEVVDIGYRVDLLFPSRQTFEGRDEAVALAWCLVFLMGESGEFGIGGFLA